MSNEQWAISNEQLAMGFMFCLVRQNGLCLDIVKQLQNTKNKNNALCINILQFKFNPVCHYEP